MYISHMDLLTIFINITDLITTDNVIDFKLLFTQYHKFNNNSL